MKVGFIGLGTMGARMADHLLADGHQMAINDLNRLAADGLVASGARWAESAAEVARATEIVFTSLPGPKEVKAVALGTGGIVDGAQPGLAFFDLSTNSPSVMRAIGEALGPLGIDVFDAPVSGGPDGAKSGRLAVWVGGDATTFKKWEPVLASFSDAPHLVGQLGAGSTAKLVHNCSGYIIQTALAETFTMGVKAGVDPEGRGWENRDSRSAMLLQEERAGVEVGVSPEKLDEIISRAGD